jgi:hypothetical protein
VAKGPIEDFGQKMAILANANEEALWINGESCYVVFIVWENDVFMGLASKKKGRPKASSRYLGSVEG